MRYILCLKWLLAVMALLGVSTRAYAQGETVLEAIARGASGRIRTAPSGKPPEVATVLRSTDLVVRGTLGEPQSYLSPDQRDVYTDYPLERPVVLFQKRQTASDKPGITPAITVTQLGGTISLNGVKFTQTEDGLPPLKPGSEGLFLLTRINDRYWIAGTFFGAFGIVDGKLKTLTSMQSFAKEFDGAPADRAGADLASLARTGK
jgi:hypothetical protein